MRHEAQAQPQKHDNGDKRSTSRAGSLGTAVGIRTGLQHSDARASLEPRPAPYLWPLETLWATPTQHSHAPTQSAPPPRVAGPASGGKETHLPSRADASAPCPPPTRLAGAIEHELLCATEEPRERAGAGVDSAAAPTAVAQTPMPMPPKAASLRVA